ncbi:serine/threonine protein kinase [Mycolicibacterium flavescens]|uniref:non-specific serine/threonine protein kinase n=1 Tax=Mycolicibacterium flavescens TaxID=1776 RepID=A0A1E3RP28_MYCFV|nr:protein kinase [Mycolicibacterium flavescens]MCV7281614.1 serine/threonine protein kinase [Mycolicibacterium flavescens]ODQ91643.1 protein kinase [Mycolicibacterium flavescens]
MEGRELLAGRYELRDVLGRGGMAEVRDGWDTRLQRPVAIKLLHPALAADPGMRRRFEDEARAAAALNHPNIVAVHDSGEHDGTPFIVMERLPGRTLADEIAAGPMAPPRVHAMLSDVLGALAAAHAVGILHRDIKPGNILVSASGETLKVADFGIAKTAGAAHTATGQIIGTMAYLSPQRATGAPATALDDLYAVGVMGYEALIGRPPYPQEHPAAVLRAILDEPLPPVGAVRPDVDPALAAVIDRAVARDPSLRFGSAAEMRAALSGTITPVPRPATKVMAQPVAQPVIAPSAAYFVARQPHRRPMSRERKLLIAAGAFVGMVVAVLALAVDPSSTAPPPRPVSTSTAEAPPPPPPVTSPPPATSQAPVVKAPKKGDGPGWRPGWGPGDGDGPGRGQGKKERD